jgi:HEAT repeat protein
MLRNSWLLFAALAVSSWSFPVRANRSLQEPATQLQAEIEKQKARLNAAEIEDRRDAVSRLGALHRTEASRAAVPALSDASPIVRVTAAAAVSSLPADEGVSVLKPLLSDKDPFVRQEVAHALGNFRSQNAVALLVERLHSDKVAGVRGAAAAALGMIGDETAVLALAQVFSQGKKKKSENEFVVRAAAHSLGQIRSRSAVPPLIAALANDSLPQDVRREAAQSLGLIGDPSAIPALQTAAGDHDPHLSRIALEALRRIETRKLT